MALNRIPDRARQHGRGARCPRTRCGARRRSAPCENFPISGLRLPRGFIRALGLIKAAAARVNAELGLLDADVADAIVAAAHEVADGRHDEQFPLDIFQTGSGTCTNMNANEVIAQPGDRSASGAPVHPNDHVNMGQSSNDVIPTAIHVSAAWLCARRCCRRCSTWHATLARKEAEVGARGQDRAHAPDGRDAGDAWARSSAAGRTQIEQGIERIEAVVPRLVQLAQGGTAVGTGINAHPEFGARFCAAAGARRPACRSRPNANLFRGARARQDAAVELSRPAQDRRRQPDEDRQRPALDEQRAARRPGRDRAAGAAAGQSASCRARSTR